VRHGLLRCDSGLRARGDRPHGEAQFAGLIGHSTRRLQCEMFDFAEFYFALNAANIFLNRGNLIAHADLPLALADRKQTGGGNAAQQNQMTAI
jgi:hypothetical protein